MNSGRSNSLSLKYKRSKPKGTNKYRDYKFFVCGKETKVQHPVKKFEN